VSGGAPPGWPRVVPRIVVADPPALVAFVREVFAATGELQGDAPTQLRIGDPV
jgi:hypothetical protein